MAYYFVATAFDTHGYESGRSGEVSGVAGGGIATVSPTPYPTPIRTNRGAWDVNTQYAFNDLVTYQGSTWLATQDNWGNPPVEGGGWTLFSTP
jgi:chitodextrinase